MKLSLQKIQGANTALIGQTYALVAAGLALAGFASYMSMGLQLGLAGALVCFAGSIGLMIAASYNRNSALGLACYLGFTALLGAMSGPMLAAFMHAPSGRTVLTEAFAATALAVGALSVYAFSSKRDFSRLSGFLFAGLLIAILAGIANIFFASPLLHLTICAVSSLIFCGYLLMDTANLANGNIDSPIEGAISLFLDIWNLFWNLAQLLLAFSGGSDD